MVSVNDGHKVRQVSGKEALAFTIFAMLRNTFLCMSSDSCLRTNFGLLIFLELVCNGLWMMLGRFMLDNGSIFHMYAVTNKKDMAHHLQLFAGL
jgi:hypothetical protein